MKINIILTRKLSHSLLNIHFSNQKFASSMLLFNIYINILDKKYPIVPISNMNPDIVSSINWNVILEPGYEL